MKKYLAVFTAISLVSTASAFKDEPALSLKESAAAIAAITGSAVAGYKVGSRAGAFTGAVGGAVAGAVAAQKVGKSDPQSMGTAAGYGGGAGYVIGGGVGAGLGTYGGISAGAAITIRALAKLHGVSLRVEAISHYYNIRVAQYRPILVAAEYKDPELLLEEVDNVYTLRFGQNWREDLEKLFKKHNRVASDLIKRGSFKLVNESQKTFARMVELGAAMSNIYFETAPKLGHELRDAKRMYKELGLLK